MGRERRWEAITIERPGPKEYFHFERIPAIL